MREEVEKIIREFNKRFSAQCELMELKGEEIVVLFKGNICFTCGTYDYFEDLAFAISEKLGKEYVVEKYIQLEDGSYLVTIKPTERVVDRKREVVVMFFEKEGSTTTFRIELPYKG